MKEYNCPDCNLDINSCKGCYRLLNKINISKDNIDLDWSKLSIKTYSNIPESCKHCSTHPINGGDGICWCVLGSQTITY